jgi:DNA-binding NarL/FixJ family response regulator
MRVLIADDHQVIRKSISSILQSRKDIRVCGEAVNGKEAVSKAQLLKPDLLILDISLPDSNGLEVATAIKKLLPEVPILLLSAYAGKQLSEEVKRRGSGYSLTQGTRVRTKAQQQLDNVRAAIKLLGGMGSSGKVTGSSSGRK